MGQSIKSRARSARAVKAGPFSGSLLLQDLKNFGLNYTPEDLLKLNGYKGFPLKKEQKESLLSMMNAHAKMCRLVPVGHTFIADAGRLALRDLLEWLLSNHVGSPVLQYLFNQWYSPTNTRLWITENLIRPRYFRHTN